MSEIEPANLARSFHEAYERLAPSFGYETRRESAKPWEDVPEQNRQLMTAVCAEMLTLVTRSQSERVSTLEEAPSEAEIVAGAQAMCFEDGPNECGCASAAECKAERATGIFYELSRTCLTAARSALNQGADDGR